jgi:hypothetical protein
MFKHMMSFAAVAGLVLALAPAAQATPFLDDFNADTSANYYNYNYSSATFTDFASPYKFDIDDSDNNILQLDDSTGSNALIHKTATLDVGETYKIDFLDAGATRGQIITSSATPGDGTSAHWYVARIRWDGDNEFDAFNFGGDVPVPSSTFDIGTTSTLTSGGSAYIERETATDFNLYYDTGASTRVKYGEFSLAADPGTIYVGVQTHNNLAPFDNLEIVGVPEPSTFVLAALGMLGMMGFGRRRNR